MYLQQVAFEVVIPLEAFEALRADERTLVRMRHLVQANVASPGGLIRTLWALVLNRAVASLHRHERAHLVMVP